MSRSYKKIAIRKDNDGAGRKRSWKKLFNRRIRRNNLDCADGGAYKKLNDSWDICDFSFTPYADDPIRRAIQERKWRMK